jgi:hypothetical protein
VHGAAKCDWTMVTAWRLINIVFGHPSFGRHQVGIGIDAGDIDTAWLQLPDSQIALPFRGRQYPRHGPRSH